MGIVDRLLSRDEIAGALKVAGGRTALHFCTEKGHVDIVSRLLERSDVSASARADIDRRTPLINAAARSHENIVSLLLMHQDVEASINSKNEVGNSALSFAAQKWKRQYCQASVGTRGSGCEHKGQQRSNASFFGRALWTRSSRQAPYRK